MLEWDYLRLRIFRQVGVRRDSHWSEKVLAYTTDSSFRIRVLLTFDYWMDFAICEAPDFGLAAEYFISEVCDSKLDFVNPELLACDRNYLYALAPAPHQRLSIYSTPERLA